MKCVVGLGNPGRRYRLTRHNAGFLTIKELESSLVCSWRRKTALYEVRRCDLEGSDVLLVEPRTFMNLSGRAVQAVCVDFDLPLQELIVVCDDTSLPVGKIRLRKKGSSGGHKGLQSVIEVLDTGFFARLRVGVGMPAPEESLEDYVLSKPARSEKRAFKVGLVLASEAVACALKDGVDAAMNRFN
ncbi:MAG: aminoacyl-tRNA hydrolase [Candidatus Eisenbacteria bacterium]